MLKKYFVSSFSITAIILALVSCSLETQENEVSLIHLGVVSGNTPSSFLIETDGGKILKPLQFPVNYEIVDGTRILAGYVIVNTVADQNHDYTVRIDFIQNVLTKNIVHANQTVRDTLANDPIQIMNVWIGNNFLNVDFVFEGNNQPHFFNLVLDPLKQDTPGHIALDFHHDANQDAPIRQFRGLASFRIQELQVAGSDSINILFRARDTQFQPRRLVYRY